MALKPKTFRTNEEVISALKSKVDELGNGTSESDIINKALRCYLGLGIEPECNTYLTEITKLKAQIQKIIELNNLKYE